MTPEQLEFLTRDVIPLERALLAHPLGGLFSGQIYLAANQRLEALHLPGLPVLDAVQVSRLFIAPDESTLNIRKTRERDDGTPDGVEVASENEYVRDGQQISVIAYDDGFGAVVRVNCLHLRSILLDEAAPERFATVAIGLLACTAFKLGFKKISLFAAGQGPLSSGEDFIGYAIWPRMGFDAPLSLVDLGHQARWLRCTTVQDVVEVDPEWWDEHGSSREMEFDLSAGSRSWTILLNYIYPIIF